MDGYPSTQVTLRDYPGVTCIPFALRSLFGNIQEEVVEDAESVRLQQQAHRQQHSCTLDECFQLYTKEEQVRGTLPAPCPCPACPLPVPGRAAAEGKPCWRAVPGAALEVAGGCCEGRWPWHVVSPSWPQMMPGAARTARCPSRAR